MQAKDLMKKLEQDPEYLKIRQKKNEEHQKSVLGLENAFLQFIDELHNREFNDIKNISDLSKLNKINAELLSVILKWIPIIDDQYGAKEILVRLLKKSEIAFDGQILTKVFDEKDSSFHLKWAIADTIAFGPVIEVTGWIDEKLANDKPGKECEMLIYAVARLFSYEKADAIFIRLFGVFPLQISDALTKIGRKKDLVFLKKNTKKFEPEIKAQINKEANKLKNRLNSSKEGE